ncbi:MAG: NAD(P)/FAD-dependent oxidoreductase [Legionellaceae bacterium]|nr:NAD(P)/FAD-dependent oxidoreductase [Legionellaceae bacterium]
MNVYLFCLTLLLTPLLHATKVAIIGGGLAGLSAAKKLNEANIETVLFEASEHFGGRVGTQVNPYGKAYYNTGGEFIDSTQAEIRELVRELGLDLKTWYEPSNKNLVETVIYDGQNFETEHEYLDPFYSKTSDKRKYLEKLVDDIELLKLHADSERAQNIKKLSIKEYFLTELGFPEKLASYLFSTLESYYAQEVDMITAGVIDEMLIDLDKRAYAISNKHDEKYRVVGGTGKIIEALLRDMPSWNYITTYSNAPVNQISKSGDKYIINNQYNEAFDYVISTLPPPVLNKIEVDIDGYQKTMAHVLDEKNYPYGVVANVYLFFDQRVWKNTPYTDDFGKNHQGYDGSVILLNEATSIWDETNGQLDKEGHEISEGILRAYFSGDIVEEKFIKQSSENINQDIIQPMLDKLETIWPGLKHAYQGFRFNACRYAYAGAVPPGVSNQVWGSYPLRVGNLILAGEFFDTGEDQSFMNGAIKSGYRAADIIKSVKSF